MSTRRQGMRIAGWLGILSGIAAMVLAVASDDRFADLAGAYGLLFVVAGAWTVAGLFLLERHERPSAMPAASPVSISTDSTETVAR